MVNMSDYFAQGELSRNWFDIVDPFLLLRLPSQNIGKPERLADRKAVKECFKSFGLVRNQSDGARVTFPAASAGKMLYQSGTDVHGIAAAFKQLFESSIRVWNEREVPMRDTSSTSMSSAIAITPIDLPLTAKNISSGSRFARSARILRFTLRQSAKSPSMEKLKTPGPIHIRKTRRMSTRRHSLTIR